MKIVKRLENLLEKNGWSLEWDKYSYWNGLPFAKKGNLRICLSFSTFNKNYRSSGIVSVLETEISGWKIMYLLGKMEEIYNKNDCYYSINNNNLGSIEYYNNKRTVEYTYNLF